jgi:hypothetical protein
VDGPSEAQTMNLVRTIRHTGYGLSNGTFQVLVGAEIGTNVDLVDYVKARTPLKHGTRLRTTISRSSEGLRHQRGW